MKIRKILSIVALLICSTTVVYANEEIASIVKIEWRELAVGGHTYVSTVECYVNEDCGRKVKKRCQEITQSNGEVIEIIEEKVN